MPSGTMLEWRRMLLRVRKRLYAAKRGTLKGVRSLLARTPVRRFMVSDIQEVGSIHHDRADITNFKVILKPRVFRYDTEYQRAFLRGSDCYRDFVYSSPERFVCTIDNASIHMESGAVSTADGVLLAESAMERQRMESSGAYQSFRPRCRRRLEGEYTTIWGLWGGQYYHWWIDCLPRIYSLVSTGVLPTTPIIMPAKLSGFQRESLAACLPEGTKVISIDEPGWIDVDRLVLPSFVTWKACGLIPPAHRDYLRNRLYAHAGVDPGQTAFRRLYVSRRNVSRRRVLNEDVLESFLADHGFESCQPETLSLVEQVRLFQEAQVVVAPHGSALVNLLFGTNLKLLEIFTDWNPATHFFFLCESLGHQYYYLFHHCPRHHDWGIRDFTVDMARFRDAYQRMMEE